MVPCRAQSEQASRDQPLPVLTRVKDIRELTPAQANLAYRVHVRAVVTYEDDQDVFIQDATAGIWVANAGQLGLRSGDLVLMDGVSASPDFAPEIAKPRARVLGKAPLPLARRVGFDRLVSGVEDSQWVEVEGIVHRATIEDGHLLLDVAVGEGRLTARIPAYSGTVPARLVDADARVVIRGAVGALFNQKNQLLGVLLYVSSLAQVRIEEAPADPADLALRPIETLLRFTPQGASAHRVKVRGVVTLQNPGRSLCLQDATGGLCARTAQATRLVPGDVVEVLGFAAPGEYSATLNDAVFRQTGTGAIPNPVPVTAQQALTGDYDGRLVQIQARLLDASDSRAQRNLILQAGNTVFYARTEEASPAEAFMASIPRGSRVSLTGVCSVQVDENRNPQAFTILLNSGTEVAVLQRASWWNLPNTLSVLGIVAVLFLAALGWILILRRRVHAQTGIILRRLQREVALEERYRDLFENASDVVYTHDLAGNLTSLNRAGELVTGYTRDEALKTNLSHIVAPEDLERACWILRGEHAQGGPETYELEIMSRSGQRIPLEVSARVIHQDGEPVGVQCNARDITERKRAEAEMKTGKEAAEAASRAKSEFLANVSHEIRTPMNGILGMTELVLETPLNAEQRSFLDVVKSSADSLMSVINDILDFSKIEAGRLDLENIEFNLRDRVSEVLKPLAVQAHRKGLELACHFKSGVPDRLLGDPGRLGQILVNLTGNALKFTQKGEVVVEVELESEFAEKSLVHFSLRDTVIGIPEEKQEIVFESFRQADGSTTREFGGTGLGLTISSQLVAMMGGKIWLESEPGKGSTFHFSASLGVPGVPPRAETAKPASMELQRLRNLASEPAGSSPAGSRALRILVAEDNVINQRLASRILEKRGHRVVLTSNGREALTALEETGFRGYDMVIMDVQMPEMDGLEATIVLRRKERDTGTHVPVIAVTAHAMKGDRERCLAAGMDEYISKPIRAQELITAIETLAKHPRAQSEPAEWAYQVCGNGA